MKCFWCETEIDGKAKICPNCGEKHNRWRAEEKERLQKIIDEPSPYENIAEEDYTAEMLKAETELIDRKMKARKKQFDLLGLGTYSFKDFLSDVKDDWIECCQNIKKDYRESGIKESWVELVDDIKNRFRRKAS
jgi:uncharacterized Zn finger protein (UPF0148 family)